MKKLIYTALMLAAMGCAKQNDPTPSNARVASDNLDDYSKCGNVSYKVVGGKNQLYKNITICDLSTTTSGFKVRLTGSFDLRPDQMDSVKAHPFYVWNGAKVNEGSVANNTVVSWANTSKVWDFNIKSDTLYKLQIVISGNWTILERDTVAFIATKPQ